jgi:Deoxyribonuclease II
MTTQDSNDPSATPSANPARVLAPLLPLAIALAYGAATHHHAPKKTAPLPATSIPTVTLNGVNCGGGTTDSPPCTVPYPMLRTGHPVDWWFAFKLNASVFPGCGAGATPTCLFGGTPITQTDGQQFIYASSETPTLQQGVGCAGAVATDSSATPPTDPIGATFSEIYNGNYHYLIWNDQFYDDPPINYTKCTTTECSGPWGHSKGVVAWNDDGNGMVMQVTTPSWPGSGSAKFPRAAGNTLGCVKNDDNVIYSQHFFALRLTKEDLLQLLTALGNSNVVTDPASSQIVSNGGPSDVQQLVSSLGTLSKSATWSAVTLSTGVELISKPSYLYVPPWQMVSAILGGVSLRTANWSGDTPVINSTDATTPVTCWSTTLAKPGAVQIATAGTWAGKVFGLTAIDGDNSNHAKIGVSTSGSKPYAIFGDMNQQGALTGTTTAECSPSQNGRGGLFFVMEQPQLAADLTTLLAGDSAPIEAQSKKPAK